MSVKSKFLTLSMKEQICLAIIFLTILCAAIILCLAWSFCYEILKEDYHEKKLYFYDKQKEYIEASFYFQNFCLLQYEEILKRMQKEIYKYHRNSSVYIESSTINYNISPNYNYVKFFDTNEHKNISQDNDDLFVLCYNLKEDKKVNLPICQYLLVETIKNYEQMSSMLFSHDIYNTFRIPGYDVPIFKSPVFADVYADFLFSYNGTLIYQILKDKNTTYTNINSDSFNLGSIQTFYRDKVKVMMTNAFNMLKYYFTDVLFLFDNIFNKTSTELSNIEEVTIINRQNLTTLYDFAQAVSGYFSSAKIPFEEFSLISYISGRFFYYEAGTVDNFLYFINNKLSGFLDISFIPLHYENNTIISPELCILFLLKQYNFQLTKEQIKILYNNMKKGVSNITDCFINKNIFKEQNNIKDVFILNCSHFLTVKNYIYEGIINIGDYPYYYIKYTYPNYNTLKEFQSEYLLLDQINFYLFVSFKDPILFCDFIYVIYQNVFFLIVLIILYTWVICLVINLFIFNKVIAQLTDPIKKLQEAIESSSIKDENIFNYEYDDFINDLFLTCKELLSGQIENNNNEKGLGQFNILSIPKDKKDVDSNKYEKNLIINNDILNQLIRDQQNMLDFSKNIKVNENLEKNSELNDFLKNTKSRKNLQDNDFLLNPDDNENDKDTNKQNDKNKLSKNDEEKEREPYKSLYKISEYLYFYQNKIENNYIHFNNNSNVVKDESKTSNLSKISNNININGSLKISGKLKKQIIRSNSYGKVDENENYSINMINNTNITYLWYMQAKKNRNKSINYNINNNYEELFNDYNAYHNNENIKK